MGSEHWTFVIGDWASQSDCSTSRLSIFNNLEEVVMDIGSVYEMDVEDING